MDNGDFIKILYNLKYDTFWNAVRVSDYEVYQNELTNSSVYDKEQGIEREFIERFNYEIEMAELSEEVAVSENTDLLIPTVEDVLENGYPVNKNGQTYGPELRSNMDPRVPDLILAKNDDGIIGYVSNREMTDYNITLEEVLENPDQDIDVLLMYLHDGETVIGEFKLR